MSIADLFSRKVEKLSDEDLALANEKLMGKKQEVRAKQKILAAEMDYRAKVKAIVKAGGKAEMVQRET